ncbi:MAG: SgcJ/EcaC family oxidoreductase [Candidatus Acidiferrales bacterium]
MGNGFRLLLMLFFFVPPAAARAHGGSVADVQAIRGIEAQWETAWNHHGIPAMVRLGAPDADWVNLAGQWFQGGKAFAKSLESLHSGKVKNSTWHTERVQARFLSQSIAVVHVYFSTTGERNPDGSLRPPRRGILTRVEEKRGGRWLIIASQATNIVPPATALLPSGAEQNEGQ